MATAGERLPDPGDSRVKGRAEALTPEERRAGTDDPDHQAEVILAESDQRSVARVAQLAREAERRSSEDTVDTGEEDVVPPDPG